MILLLIAGIKNPNPDFFTKSKVEFIRPLMAIGIVLHHMNSESVLMNEFERWGPLIVGLFFFISGYGLSFNARNKEYLNKFFTVNIVQKLILPLSLAFVLHYILNGLWTGYSLIEHLVNPLGPSLIPNDWFIFALIYCYLVFMVAMKSATYKVQTLIIIVGVSFLVSFTYISGFSRNWWATPLAFCIGFIFQIFETKILNVIQGMKKRIMLNVLFVFLLIGVMYISDFFERNITAILAYSFLLPLWIVMTLSYYNNYKSISIKFFSIIGSISFEIYLMHGIVISWLHRITPLRGMNFVITALLLSIIVAILFSRVIYYTRLVFKKMVINECHG